MYDKLFEPGSIGKVQLKNRLVMEPMGCGLANLDGTPTDEMIAYYVARAKGGVGLIIPEICRVDEVTGIGELRQISAGRDDAVPGMARLAQAIHEAGAKAFIQLHHPGRETPNSLLGGAPAVSASAIPCKKTQAVTRALTTDEVKHIIQEFIDGAVRMQKAGFDGVELHCAHGYLLQQFLSPYTNHRDDEYGGSFENRLRMVLEIIAGIRAACGPDFALGCRVSVEEFLDRTGVTEDYIRVPDGVKICMAFERAGVDFIDVSVGLYETGTTCVEPISFPEGWRHDIIAAVKSHVQVPVLAVSAYRGPDVPNAFLEEGVIDFAGLGRALLADPEWPNKVRDGRTDELRKCISCLRCFESLEQNASACMPFECAVNAECANELRYAEMPADVEHHNVVVVGGGPAGMSAAETAARRGSRVTLIEKDAQLGGDTVIAGAPPHKEKMAFVTDYYEAMLPKLGVDVRLNTEATVESVKALNPDAVICATGATPIVPASIPGASNDIVTIVDPVLQGKVDLADKNVVIVGAGMTGLETAEYAAAHGAAKVTVVDMVDRPAPTANQSNVADVMGRLRPAGVVMALGQRLTAITGDGVTVVPAADEAAAPADIPADLVILSLGSRPDQALADALRAEGVDVRVVGSAVKDGMISPAVHGGYEAARGLFAKPQVGQASWHSLPEDVARFGHTSVMGDQRGIYTAFTTRPEAIAQILPPPLRPFEMPVVVLSINHINKPNFTPDYYEAILGVYCYCGDQLGQYSLSLLLGGNGAEMATQLGRDNGSMPKKLGAEFSIRRTDDGRVVAAVSRHGHDIAKVTMELGRYNTPLAHRIFQAPEAGKTTKGCGFYFHFDRPVQPEGGARFASGALNAALAQYDYAEWTPGYITDIQLASSPDDPWGELPVVCPLGGGLSTVDLTVCGMRKLVDVDAEATFPYLLSSWYDRSTLGELGQI